MGHLSGSRNLVFLQKILSWHWPLCLLYLLYIIRFRSLTWFRLDVLARIPHMDLHLVMFTCLSFHDASSHQYSMPRSSHLLQIAKMMIIFLILSFLCGILQEREIFPSLIIYLIILRNSSYRESRVTALILSFQLVPSKTYFTGDALIFFFCIIMNTWI